MLKMPSVASGIVRYILPGSGHHLHMKSSRVKVFNYDEQMLLLSASQKLRRTLVT
jgi:hypothetical protein